MKGGHSMASVKHIFNDNDRILFDSCCQYFELALAYFGYNAQTQCYLSDKNKILLFAVNITYNAQNHQFFTALTLEEFYKKMELLYHIYLYAKDHQCGLEESLNYFLEQQQQFIVIQDEIDNLLSWKDFIDDEINRTGSYSYNTSHNENRTLH